MVQYCPLTIHSSRRPYAARHNSGVRQHMKLLGSLGLIALTAIVISGCNPTPKIDGSSEEAFERSHATLVASLSPEDRMRLTLAELVLLSPKGCLTTKPSLGQPFLNDTLGGQADLSSCRKELHGLTFKDIMALAYPQGEPATGSAPRAA